MRGQRNHQRNFDMRGDCQKTSSQILTSACIKMTFSGLLKTQEAYFEIKIHGEKNKTWNVFCFNGAEKTTERIADSK